MVYIAGNNDGILQEFLWEDFGTAYVGFRASQPCIMELDLNFVADLRFQ